MTEIDTSILPDDLVDKAIRSYRFETSADVGEKLLIHQWRHLQESGDFSVSVSQSEEYVHCSLETEDDNYQRKVPKLYTDFDAEIYPIGDVNFEKAELMSVSAVGGFPWTEEVFSAFYWGTINTDSIEDEDEWFEDVRVLQQYFPPRSVTSEPPECTIKSEHELGSTEFMTVDIRNATHCKTPNPWSYAAFAVLYENPEPANQLLSHDQVRGDPSDYQLTPPKSLQQPLVDINY